MKMKYIDLKDQDVQSLNNLLKEKKLLLFSLKHKLKLMQVTNTNELLEVRRDIARLNMILTNKKKELKNA